MMSSEFGVRSQESSTVAPPSGGATVELRQAQPEKGTNSHNKKYMTKLFSLLSALFFVTITIAQPSKGSVAPDISLQDMNGKTVSLSSLKGKVVLIDFWASWCGPCRKANKHLVAIYPKLKAKGFEIYSISIDDDKSDWKKAVAADKITWLQVNEKGWEGQVAHTWKIEQIPATWLLDKEGRVVAVDPEGKDLERKINALLKQ